MKNILSLFSIVALLFAACEPANDPSTGKETEQIKLTSDATINVSSSSAMAFLSYQILEIVDGAEVKAEADVNWITNFDYKQQGKIQFTVEKNPDAEVREGTITVSYDKSKFEVKVIQALSEAPTNMEIKAELLQGKYYGIVQGMYNYYILFTDLGMDSNNNFMTPNAYYYFVDLYLLTDPEDMSNIVIPNGEYEYDVTNSGYANTFMESFSWFQTNDESGWPMSQAHYEKGKLIVEDGKITLDVTFQVDNVQVNHKVVYEGDYALLDCTSENM